MGGETGHLPGWAVFHPRFILHEIVLLLRGIFILLILSRARLFYCFY